MHSIHQKSLSSAMASHPLTTVGRCSTEGRIDAHRLSPPRYCNAFADAADCERHFTPRGLCKWGGTACSSATQCAHRISSPTGSSYIFFKFHKVGSSTVGGTVRMALLSATGNVFSSCLRVSKLRNKTEVERARYAHCSLCARLATAHALSRSTEPAFCERRLRRINCTRTSARRRVLSETGSMPF